LVIKTIIKGAVILTLVVFNLIKRTILFIVKVIKTIIFGIISIIVLIAKALVYVVKTIFNLLKRMLLAVINLIKAVIGAVILALTIAVSFITSIVYAVYRTVKLTLMGVYRALYNIAVKTTLLVVNILIAVKETILFIWKWKIPKYQKTKAKILINSAIPNYFIRKMRNKRDRRMMKITRREETLNKLISKYQAR